MEEQVFLQGTIRERLQDLMKSSKIYNLDEKSINTFQKEFSILDLFGEFESESFSYFEKLYLCERKIGTFRLFSFRHYNIMCMEELEKEVSDDE